MADFYMPKEGRIKHKKSLKESSINLRTELEELIYRDMLNLRYELAVADNVPHYAIMHDKTIYEIVEKKPCSLDELSNIYGIGNKRLNSFGQNILDIIHLNLVYENEARRMTKHL
jgi:superfamily II DNA helicase RecQ